MPGSKIQNWKSFRFKHEDGFVSKCTAGLIDTGAANVFVSV